MNTYILPMPEIDIESDTCYSSNKLLQKQKSKKTLTIHHKMTVRKGGKLVAALA